MIDLRIYLPEIYFGVLEMEELMDTENYAFNELFEIVQDAQNDQYVLRATSRGLQAMESMLGIYASADDSTEFRRERLINRLAKDVVYTVNALKARLNNILSVGSYAISQDFNAYTFNITISTGTFGMIQEVKNTLAEIVPANLIVNLSNSLMAISVARVRPVATTTIGMTYTLL